MSDESPRTGRLSIGEGVSSGPSILRYAETNCCLAADYTRQSTQAYRENPPPRRDLLVAATF